MKRCGRENGPRIGIALAGGGPAGAIYEIGAVRALDEAVDGLDLNHLDIYVGVSAGAFIAACLANQLSTGQMCRAIVKSEPGEHPFLPENFFKPAMGEFLNRTLSIPRLVRKSLKQYFDRPGDAGLIDSFTRVSRALPVGVFENEPIREYLHNIYSIKGRTDDFRELGPCLRVVAADLESGEAVVFGAEGNDEVPISTAVQGSTALPGPYPPVLIKGRYIVDGVMLKTLHASVALEAEMDLVFCINPIVPVDLREMGTNGHPNGYLVSRGLPAVLSQTLRTLIHSRLVTGLNAYNKSYPDARVVLLEPSKRDYRMFFTNIFTFSGRRVICSDAYKATRRELLKRYEEFAPQFAKVGLELRRDILEEERDLWTGVDAEVPPQGAAGVFNRLDDDLNRLESLLSSF